MKFMIAALLALTPTVASSMCIGTHRALAYAQAHDYKIELVRGRAADDLKRLVHGSYGSQIGELDFVAAVKKNGTSHLFVGNATWVCGPLS